MAKIDETYRELLKEVMYGNNSYTYEDANRKGVFRREISSYTLKHNLIKDGFPLITTKEINFNNILVELLWFISGNTNIKYLHDNNCHIWDSDGYNYYKKIKEILSPNTPNMPFKEWKENSQSEHIYWDLGRIYGHYWRNFNGVDQLKDLVHNMKNSPYSSELLVVARNPADRDRQCLPSCHYGYQIICYPLSTEQRLEIFKQEYSNRDLGDFAPKGGMEVQSVRHQINNRLNNAKIPEVGFELHWNQRSSDLFLGIPYNIASYALLSLILERLTGLKAVGIQGNLSKVHIYDNALEASTEQIGRDTDKYPPPTIKISDTLTDLGSINKNMFSLEGYNSFDSLKVKMLSRDK